MLALSFYAVVALWAVLLGWFLGMLAWFTWQDRRRERDGFRRLSEFVTLEEAWQWPAREREGWRV